MFLQFILRYKWVVGLVAALLTIIGYHYTAITVAENSGYDRAVRELNVATIKAVKEATDKVIKQSTIDMQEAIDRQQSIFDTELERTKNERVVEYVSNEVIKHVDRVVIKNECTDTDDSVIRLLNKSVSAHNSASSRNTKGGS